MNKKVFSLISFLSILTFQVHAQSWSDLAGGVNSNVYSLATDTAQNVMYAAGRFWIAGGTSVSKIAKWDGTTWSDVGGGFNNDVYSVYLFNGELYAGGAFTFSGTTALNHIAKWDGSNWTPLNAGFDNDVYRISSYNNELVAGGIFTLSDTIIVNRVAHWSGTDWSSYGNGVGAGPGDYIEGLASFQGDLYVGGHFADASGVNANGVARWNGSAWDSLGAGISGLSQTCSDLFVFQNELLVGGQFTGVDTLNAAGMARWNGINWLEFNTGGVTGGQNEVRRFWEIYNLLYIGGNFSQAGGVTSPFISAYDGITWAPLGGGIDNVAEAFTSYDGKLIAGGSFDFADTLTVNNIASWSPACAIGTIMSSVTPSCIGQCDGTATVVATGNGTLSYTWQTNPVQTNATATNLCIGTYAVIVTDTTGCSRTDSVAVINPPLVGISFNAVHPSCPGSCNGNVTVVATGRAPFTYVWSTGSFTDTISGLCPGTYTVSVSDSAGCVFTDSVVIVDPVPNSISFTPVLPSCFESCNGTITATSTGTSPFIYQWSSGDTSATAVNLCSGVYSVTATDSLGCTATDLIFLVAPAPNVATASSTQPTCFGGCNGTASVISTGLAPFTYAWSNADTNAVAIALCAGTYIATVTDSLGCIAMDTIDVINPPSAILTFTPGDAVCPQVCNGTASVSSNSTAPFTYAWSNGDIGQITSNLCGGNFYSVTVTDSLGCSVTDSVQILAQPSAPISFFTNSVSCASVCNGTALAISNSFPPYTYAWSNGDVSAIADSLCIGSIIVSITDNLGCISTDSVFVNAAPPPSVSFTTQSTDCSGGCTGSATANITSSSPVFLSWSNGDTTQTTSNLCYGNYFLTITDTSGCVFNDSVSIAASGVLPFSIASQNPVCYNDCNGSANITLTGGIAPYTFTWSNDSLLNSGTNSNLCAGTYYFSILDSVGCQASDSVSIFNPAPIVVTLNKTDVLCNGACDGTAIAVASGTGPVSYAWQTIPPQNTDTAIGLCFGFTSVITTDSLGCQSLDSILILEPDPINPNIIVNDATCYGVCDGSLTVNVLGGIPPYIFDWGPVIGPQPGNTLLQLCASPNYIVVTVYDDNGCFVSDSAIVSSPPQLQVTLTSSNTSCIGCNDGSAIASISGGTAPYSFIWTPVNNITDTNIINLSPGVYVFCVNDNNNCGVVCDSVTISDPNGLVDLNNPIYSLRIYPNPTKDFAYVKTPLVAKNSSIHFYDLVGKEINSITSEKFTGSTETVFRINKNQTPDGIYIIRVFDSGILTGTGKLIITE